MAILVDEKSRVLVQGITGHEGTFHTRQMLEYGTAVVAGVTPGKGGSFAVDGHVPVFDTVAEAAKETGADTSVIYVPARFAAAAMIEAADAGIRCIVTITEGIPVLDMIRVRAYLESRDVVLIGPNCPGVLSPGKAKAGIIPGQIARPGRIGVVSRSGTLTYEVVAALTAESLGQSTCVGIGGDPIIGLDFIGVLERFDGDSETDGVVLIGEIGGNDEERAAAYISERFSKPVVALIAGRTAPADKRMGHAGAIIQGGVGGAAGKIAALEAAGVAIATYPSQVPGLIRPRLSEV